MSKIKLYRPLQRYRQQKRRETRRLEETGGRRMNQVKEPDSQAFIEVMETNHRIAKEPSEQVKLIDLLTELKTAKGVENEKDLINDLIDNGYIEVIGDRSDWDSEIDSIDISQLKKELGMEKKFNIKDDLSKSEIASQLADYLIEHRGIKPVKRESAGEGVKIQIWGCGEEMPIWDAVGMQKPKMIAKQQLEQNVFSTHLVRELKNEIESTKPLSESELGLEKPKIAVQNTAVNLETLQKESLNQDDYAINQLNAEFEKPEQFTDDHESLGCPKFGEYLKEVVPEEKQRKKLQEYVGYCLMHWTTKYEKALLILGPTDSGKGVFLYIIENLLGQENISNHDFDYLANKNWGLVDLESNMANIAHELGTNNIADMGQAKQVISGDSVMAENKRQQPFKIKPKAKHIYAANRPPKRSFEDEAFYNRWLTVIFPNSIPKEDQDDALIEKLTGYTKKGVESEEHEGELSGIFNWAIAGYKRLQQQKGGFTGELSIDATRQIWQEYGSSVSTFKEEFMVKEEMAKVPTKAAHEAYKMFAKVQGFEIEGHSGFSRQINNDPEIRKGPRQINSDNYNWADIDKDSQRCFVGIRLKSGAVEELRNLVGEENVF